MGASRDINGRFPLSLLVFISEQVIQLPMCVLAAQN